MSEVDVFCLQGSERCMDRGRQDSEISLDLTWATLNGRSSRRWRRQNWKCQRWKYERDREKESRKTERKQREEGTGEGKQGADHHNMTLHIAHHCTNYSPITSN